MLRGRCFGEPASYLLAGGDPSVGNRLLAGPLRRETARASRSRDVSDYLTYETLPLSPLDCLARPLLLGVPSPECQTPQ